MTHWLQQIFRQSPSTQVAKQQRIRLGVQTLEDRVVPAVTVGALDTLFDTDGKLNTNINGARDDSGRAMAIQTDGKIVVAGTFDFDTPGGAIDFAVLRYNPNGSLDTTFDTDGKLTLFYDVDGSKSRESRATSVAIQSDGKIVVGGFITTATTGRDAAVFRLNANGSLDTTFDGDGLWNRPTLLTGNDEISALGIQTNGQIVAVGYSTVSGANTDMLITRLNTDGSIDATLDRAQKFDSGGTNADVANALAIAPNGKIVVVGTANTGTNNDDIAVMVVSPDGTLDTTFDVDGLQLYRHDNGNTPERGTMVTIQPDGQYLIGGNVLRIGITDTDMAVFRINPNGTYDTTFDTDGKQVVRLAGTNETATSVGIQFWDNVIVVGGTMTLASAQTDFTVARLNPNGSLDTTFGGGGAKNYSVSVGGTFSDVLGSLLIDSVGRITLAGTSATATNGTDVSLLRFYGRDIPLVVDSTNDDADFNLEPGNFTLREAIFLSNLQAEADTITFADSINGSTITLGGTRLEVRRPVTILGPSQGVVVDANNASQVFYFDGRTNGTFNSTLSNLTITRGATGDSEEIIDTFNSGNYGGGIINDRTNLTLNGVTMTNNKAGENGGAIHNWQGTNSKLTINGSLFVGNSANYGGAIYNWVDATVNITNTTFSGNTSIIDGGAIQQDGGLVSLVNVTGTLNKADSDNNGSGNGGFLSINTGTVTMHNSIVAGNIRGATIPDEFGSSTLDSTSSYNLVLNAATSGGLINNFNNNLVGVDPLLQPLGSNGGSTLTHALGQNSPALGKASTTVPGYFQYDQRSTARDNRTPDIGAYEVQHPLATIGAPTTLATLYAPKPSATANEAFVKGLYQATLLRPADQAGLAGWLTLLNGGATRSSVASGFVNSIENRTNQVKFFYRYFLGREAEPAGLNFWVDQLRSGVDEGTVMTGFILSEEFSGNNNNAQFVNLMYYALLSRPADAAGFNGWLNALNNGASRATVAIGFLRSAEGINRVVDSMSQTYLKRYAFFSELNTYRTFLQTNTFGTAAVQILAGTEFFTNAQNNMT